MADVQYAIIGGGVIGRAIALALSSRDGDIAVLERCPANRVENQSTRNSGVIHAGIYYRRAERPIKARLCVEGNARLYEFCQRHNVPHANTGKLVVATNSREEGYLQGILAIAEENAVPGVCLLSGEEARAMEPNIRATAALLAPTSGVIDSAAYLAALRRAGPAHSLFATEVTRIAASAESFTLETVCSGKTERFTARYVINAAGAQADEVAKMLNPDSTFALVPSRGEAAKFYQSRRPELAMGGRNIYPVPAGFYPDGTRANVPFAEFQRLLKAGAVTETVGVHLTPTLNDDGQIAATMTIGPAIHAGVIKDDLATGLYPPAHYLHSVSEYFPGLRESDIELHQAGIQARMAGQLDWYIQSDAQHERFIHVLGIDSPGMTGSLAIARYVAELLDAARR
jgi:L-2-hydroxyglutarate oxidase LhgO